MLFNDISKKQKILIQSLEGLGDILILDVENKKNDRVKNGLKAIHGILSKLMGIRKRSPDIFKKMLLHQEFFRIYKENREEAQLRIAFSPEKYLIAFSSAINQIIRVHQTSIKYVNEEASRYSAYHLNWVLSELSQEPDNEIFIKQVLNSMSDMGRDAIKNDDPSIYAASVQWYPDIIFNKMSQESGLFRLEYLDTFDKYYYSSIKYIISLGKLNIYQAFVSTICEGFIISSWDAGKIWDYGHIVLDRDIIKYREMEERYNVENKLRMLSEAEGGLDTIEKLKAWLNDYNEFKSIIDPYLSEQERETAKALDKEITGYVESQFKYNNFIRLVFAIGAYCVFKNKPEYIKYLWEYKQPADSSAVWCGHDIVPTNLSDLVSKYYSGNMFERKYGFWEGHHGSELYLQQYYILLLARIIRAVSEDKVNEVIMGFQLPKIDVYQLSSIESSIDGMVDIANKLGENLDFILRLGLLSEEDALLIFSQRVTPFLKSLKSKAQSQIANIEKEQPISQKRVSEFKEEVISSFYEHGNMRYLFKYLNKYIDKSSDEYVGELGLFGINTVDDKAAYFDKWHISFVGWAENRGSQIATGEDEQILASIITNCNVSTIDYLEATIRNDPNVIIISTFPGIYRSIEDSDKFVPKWAPNIAVIPKIDNSEIKGFQGWYKLDDKYIPIFYAWNRELEKGLLVLNKDNIGQFIQYNPLEADADRTSKKDIFYFHVKAFSEDESLLNRFIIEPPEWLKKIGNEEQQKEYLKERVLLKIYERFEFKPINNHKSGYFLKMKEE